MVFAKHGKSESSKLCYRWSLSNTCRGLSRDGASPWSCSIRSAGPKPFALAVVWYFQTPRLCAPSDQTLDEKLQPSGPNMVASSQCLVSRTGLPDQTLREVSLTFVARGCVEC